MRPLTYARPPCREVRGVLPPALHRFCSPFGIHVRHLLPTSNIDIVEAMLLQSNGRLLVTSTLHRVGWLRHGRRFMRTTGYGLEDGQAATVKRRGGLRFI